MGDVVIAEQFEPMGSDILEVPFLWVPEGAPRPGYPWFEAGRMTVSAERLAAWSAAKASQRSGQARSGDQGGAAGEQQHAPPDQRQVQLQPSGDVSEQAVTGPWSVDVGNDTTAAAEAPLARYGPSEVGAAIKAWDARSDPRMTLAALDAASASNPIVSSLAQGAESPAAGPPIQQDILPPLPPPLPPTINDTDLERGALLPWKQPNFIPGTNDRIYIPSDTEPPGRMDPSMQKDPPGDDVPAERPFRNASVMPPGGKYDH